MTGKGGNEQREIRASQTYPSKGIGCTAHISHAGRNTHHARIHCTFTIQFLIKQTRRSEQASHDPIGKVLERLRGKRLQAIDVNGPHTRE